MARNQHPEYIKKYRLKLLNARARLILCLTIKKTEISKCCQTGCFVFVRLIVLMKQ